MSSEGIDADGDAVIRFVDQGEFLDVLGDLVETDEMVDEVFFDFGGGNAPMTNLENEPNADALGVSVDGIAGMIFGDGGNGGARCRGRRRCE